MSAKQADFVKTAIRMPPELHKSIHELAKKQDRTFNGQLLAMLKEVAAKSDQQTPGETQ
jgi:hypothetical protein